jgi:hypothetical protein
MNLVILINSAWMFFRNFGLRHVTAALGHFALELADPNTDQKIITRSARLVEWFAIAALPAGSREVDTGPNSEPLSFERRGQRSADNRLSCRPPDIAARDRIRRFPQLLLSRSDPGVFRNGGRRQSHERVRRLLAGRERRKRRTQMTATLQRMVRDPRTGAVHVPHEPLSIIRTMENLGRILIKIKWQTGDESVLLPDDIDAVIM